MGNEADKAQDSAYQPQPSPEGAGEVALKSSASRWRKRVTWVSLLLVALAAGVVLPPLINIGRYQRQITALMSRSMGRPVHLSGVEMRLLPTPAFVLHDLTVTEDPSFGAEPILFARTVVASVRLFSLWRGKIEVSRVSVDEASLNLVRTPQGRWNLESVLMGAASNLGAAMPSAQAGIATGTVRRHFEFPYLEATNSRVNLKNGIEKSPFSIVETDLSLWQDQPGAWRVRLRGQPVRTDMEMSLADTGELRMEASLHTAPQLREMPLKLQVEWRDAQLGQLSRLLLGSDAGWRGDMTADIDVQGTPDSAQTTARLRTTSVRRQEFAPETPLDFDANCKFRYQHSLNAFHDVICNTAIGGGRLQLQAEVPGTVGPPEAKLEVNQIALQAALDLLRTVRSGFAPGIVARGTATGSLTYRVAPPQQAPPARASAVQGSSHPASRPRSRASLADNPASPSLSLQGSLTVEGGTLSGGDFKEPLVLPTMSWLPVRVAVPGAGSTPESVAPLGLESRFLLDLSAAKGQTRPASGRRNSPPVSSEAAQAASLQAVARPVAIRLALSPAGYNGSVNGSAESEQLRELAYALGSPHLDALDEFEGGTVNVDLTGAGPWLPTPESSEPRTSPPPVSASTARKAVPSRQAPPNAEPGSEALAGTLHVASVVWKPPFLASAVQVSQGALTISGGESLFAADFTYGGIAGSVSVKARSACNGSHCAPQVQLRFGSLDAALVQSALLGAPAQKSLLAPLTAQLAQFTQNNQSDAANKTGWPDADVNVQAESLTLGPAILHKPVIDLELNEGQVRLTHWEANLLAGSAQGTGAFSLHKDGPAYSLEGKLTNINASQLGALFSSHWSGGAINASGSIQLSGLTAKQFAASAQGDVTFDWLNGVVSSTPTALAKTGHAAAPSRFDQWSGKLAIKDGKAALAENYLVSGKRKTSATGEIPFEAPAKLVFPSPVQ